MKTILRFLALLWGCFCLSSCCSTPTSPGEPPKNAPSVSQIIKTIQTAIDPFFQPTDDNSGLPKLKSVKLSLQTVIDDKTSAEADYLIVALKGYYDSSHTTQLDIILSPEKPPEFKELSQPTYDPAKELRKAIESAQKEIQKTYASTTPGHTLYTTEVDVQISFSVTWDGSIGVNKWSLLPISISASKEVSSKTANTITVTFANQPK